MRIVQVVENEKKNEKPNQQPINRRDILNSLVYNSSDYNMFSFENHGKFLSE